MNATESKSKIITGERRAEELRAEINRLETRRTNLLREMPVEPSATYESQKLADFLRQVEDDLDTYRAELRRLKDQIEVLRDGLPSEDQVAEADARAGALLDAAQDYSTSFSIEWNGMLDALAEAGEAARRAIAYRAQHRTAVSEAASLVEQFGLTREDLPNFSARTGPEKLAAPRAEVDLGNAFLDLLQGAVNGEIEPDRAALSRIADLQAKLRGLEAEAA